MRVLCSGESGLLFTFMISCMRRDSSLTGWSHRANALNGVQVACRKYEGEAVLSSELIASLRPAGYWCRQGFDNTPADLIAALANDVPRLACGQPDDSDSIKLICSKLQVRTNIIRTRVSAIKK